MRKFESLLKGKIAENGFTLAKLSEMFGVIPQNLLLHLMMKPST